MLWKSLNSLRKLKPWHWKLFDELIIQMVWGSIPLCPASRFGELIFLRIQTSTRNRNSRSSIWCWNWKWEKRQREREKKKVIQNPEAKGDSRRVPENEGEKIDETFRTKQKEDQNSKCCFVSDLIYQGSSTWYCDWKINLPKKASTFLSCW